jgi:hypothetical protein
VRGADGAPAVGDLAFDAQLLAEYGDPPRHWFLAPVYAWRVLRRQRELKRVLAGRRAEAERALVDVGDALVALCERVRPAAEKHTKYAAALEELHRAEELLRSRDQVLAAEQDAQNARLAAVDARITQLETDLAGTRDAERTVSLELAATQTALAREENKLKRAEGELRTAQQREAAEARG